VPSAYGEFTEPELREDYLRDLQDTANEMSYIIKSYEKHGEPQRSSRTGIQELKKKQSASPPAVAVPKIKKTLEMPNPDKVTLAWLFHNVPIKFWWWLAGILIAAFILGITIGQ